MGRGFYKQVTPNGVSALGPRRRWYEGTKAGRCASISSSQELRPTDFSKEHHEACRNKMPPGDSQARVAWGNRAEDWRDPTGMIAHHGAVQGSFGKTCRRRASASASVMGSLSLSQDDSSRWSWPEISGMNLRAG